MTLNDADLIRIFSHALRHEACLSELELDEAVWVSVQSLSRRSGADRQGLGVRDPERNSRDGPVHRG